MKKKASSPLSRRSLAQRAVLLLIVFLVAGSIAFPQGANWLIARVNQVTGANVSQMNIPLSLGLDLQGGTRLEYVADLSQIPESERAEAMEGVRDVIERRVNALGVSEPIVQTVQAGSDWRLVVELAGIRDIREAIRVIGETPTLDFREENPNIGTNPTDEEYAEIAAKNTELFTKAQGIVERIKSGESLEEIARAESDIAATQGGDVGFILEAGGFLGLQTVLRDVPVGFHENVLDDGEYLYIADVLERKPAGNEMRASHILVQWSDANSAEQTRTKEEARARIEEAKQALESRPFNEVVAAFSDEPDAATNFGDLDWFPKGVMVPAFEDATTALAVDGISDIIETPFGFHIIQKTGERPVDDVHARIVALKKASPADSREPWVRTTLTGKQLSRAQLDFDQQTGQAIVSLQFDDEGSQLFADLTKKNIGKPIGIFLDDQPISVPVVNQEIPGGQAVISGGFTVEEAKLLAQRLQAGALPVPIAIIAQQNVGPTLGAESVGASVRAALVGFLIVALFMLLVYRLPGLLAVVALTFYAAVVFALFKLIPVTLTLSGIAGFILSVGIAVDANVLIFERLKEELREGKPMGPALEDAFRRAWLSIRDGNVTTLIACAVLYWFSSSVIKGFALTLAIGVLVSMFSAIVVTRILLRFAAHPRFVQAAPWLFLKK